MLNRFNYEYFSHPSRDVMFPIGKTPASIDYIAFYVCEGGTVDIKIDGKSFIIDANTLCVGLPGSIIGIDKVSKNLKGFGAKASILFIDELFIPNIGGYYTHIKNSPCTKISRQQLTTIKKLTEIINGKINCNEGQLSFLVAQNLLNSLVYEIISCYANEAAETQSSRQDAILREFMHA